MRQTQAYSRDLLADAARTGAWAAGTCPAIQTAKREGLAILKAPMFDAGGKPQSGAWVEHLAVDGCGPTRQLNVLVLVSSPGSIAMVPLLPGSTRADPTLQKDGAVFAFTTAQIDQQGCKPIYIAETRFVGMLDEAPLAPGKPGWSEIWTVAQCDKRADIDMRFVPDGKGTVITAKRATAAAQ